MHPDIMIPLIGAEIKAYALFTVLGALAFAAAALPLLKRAGVKPPRALTLIAAMAVAFLIGARLWNVAVNPGAYGGALKWYSLKLAGFSLYGGVLGAALALLAWVRLTLARPARALFLPILDAIVLPSGLAFALARVGCFLNGCCCGILTHSTLGVMFPDRGGTQEMLSSLLPFSAFTLQAKRYPTQLFELALALFGLIPALAFGRKLSQGSTFLLYGVWFSVARIVILPLRSLPYDDIVKNAAYPALYLTLTALSAAALVFINKRRQENEKVRSI